MEDGRGYLINTKMLLLSGFQWVNVLLSLSGFLPVFLLNCKHIMYVKCPDIHNVLNDKQVTTLLGSYEVKPRPGFFLDSKTVFRNAHLKSY